VVKWLVIGMSAVILVAALQIVVQWWSGHVLVNFLETHPIPGSDRIQPRLFNVTGIVPIAYTLFAFALGAALGAVFRRTVWAILGTVVGYGSAAAWMVVGIRPSLASRAFVSQTTTSGYVPVPHLGWYLGYAFRPIPGIRHPVAPSAATEIVQSCQGQLGAPYLDYQHCLTTHGIEGGSLYQPLNHYWALQWGEAAIYAIAALALFGLTLWAVRRWRA
jgi:hypothetical protein